MIGDPVLLNVLMKMGALDSEQVQQQKADEERAREAQASALTLKDVERDGADVPRASELMPMREAAAAAVGLRVLTSDELRPKFKDGQRLPEPARFDLPGWCEVYAKHIRNPDAKALVLRFLDLVGVCGLRLGVGLKEKVIYGDVVKLAAELHEPAPVAPAAEPTKGTPKKLSDAQEQVITRRHAAGASQESLSKEFGVSRPLIKNAIVRWSEAAPNPNDILNLSGRKKPVP